MARSVLLYIQWLLAWPIRLGGGGLLLAGGYTVVAQAILWMRSGHWVELPLLYLFVDPFPLLAQQFPLEAWKQIQSTVGNWSKPWFILQVPWHTYLSDEFSNWLNNPQSWLGLHKAVMKTLDAVPMSVMMLGAGITMASSAGLWLEEHIEPELETLNDARRKKRESEESSRQAVVEWESASEEEEFEETDEARLERISSWFETLATSDFLDDRFLPLKLPILSKEEGELQLFYRDNEEEVKSTEGYKKLMDECKKRGLQVRFENDYAEMAIAQSEMDLPRLAPTLYHVYVVVS